MTFSPFDRRMMEDGLAWFSRPRLASLLEFLGADERERLDALVTMLRHAPAVEFEEAIDLFDRAEAKAARHRLDEHRDRVEEPRRRRYSASAERREQRRRG